MRLSLHRHWFPPQTDSPHTVFLRWISSSIVYFLNHLSALLQFYILHNIEAVTCNRMIHSTPVPVPALFTLSFEGLVMHDSTQKQIFKIKVFTGGKRKQTEKQNQKELSSHEKKKTGQKHKRGWNACCREQRGTGTEWRENTDESTQVQHIRAGQQSHEQETHEGRKWDLKWEGKVSDTKIKQEEKQTWADETMTMMLVCLCSETTTATSVSSRLC